MTVFNYLPSYKKLGKINDPFLKKNAELTDKRMERQRDTNGDFIGPSVGRESNK